MPDLLGNLISIADPTISGVFPLPADFDVERSSGAEYVVHKIGLKKEQRILKRKGGNRWKVTNRFTKQSQLETLYTFFDAHRSPQQLFYFYDPFESGGAIDLTGASVTGRYIVRFATTDLPVNYLLDGVAQVDVELVEVNTATTAVLVGVNWQYRNWRRTNSVETFTQAAITDDYAVVHLAMVTPINAADEPIRVSDRRTQMVQNFNFGAPTVRTGIYVPRLLAWDLEQEIDSSDQASFVFDDADGVWSAYCKQVDLDRAEVDFTVAPYIPGGPAHAELIQLWRGYVVDWEWNQKDGTFTLQCAGGINALQQQFPLRTISTTCQVLRFNDGVDCPYSAQGSGGDANSCDKSLDGANGCAAHGMTNYFQGVVIKPQAVSGKLNNTGVAGFFKKGYTTTSTPLKTVYGKTLPVIYGLGRQIVEADIFETRDESEFFVASGLLSEGPLGSIGQVLLDGMTQHYGYQPVKALGALAQNIGTIIDPAFRSSRAAFVSIRRTDTVGLQNPNEPHSILVEILNGVKVMTFWWWTGPFTLGGESDSSNPVEIAVDIALRAVGLRYALDVNSYSNKVKDYLLNLDSYTEARLWCAQQVPVLVGSGTEARFEYRGVLREPKPALDHMREVLGNAPIDLVWSFGQISPKVRKDDITTPPTYQVTFEEAQNIIDGSFRSQRLKPKFNHLTLLYSDIDYDFAERDINVHSEAHMQRMSYLSNLSTPRKPLPLKAQRTLSGGFRASQVMRLATQLLYEELGGVTDAEQLKARTVSLSAPLVGLAVEVGDVSRVIHSELPDGQAYVRWKRWRYSSDLLVQLSGPTVTASMYAGPVPQLPSDTTGDPVDGIPGGSQGTDGSENTPAALTPPVIAVRSVNYRTAIVEVSAPPELVNYLITEDASALSFAGATSLTLSLPVATFEVNGTAGSTRYVRAKWRRSAAIAGPPAIPAEESAWSNTLAILFAKVQASEIEGVPDPIGLAEPQVPVIRSVLGWSEFIELCLIGKSQAEGATVGYGVAQMTQNGGSCIYIQNTSTDPSIAIVEAALIIGEPFPQIDCHGDKTIAAGFHPGDVYVTGTPIADVSNYAPYLAAPPVAEFEVGSGQIKYYQVATTPPAGVDPGDPDYACLSQRCPEPTDPGYNAIAKCISVFDVAKTPAGFSLPGGSNYHVKVDSGIARAFGIYNQATGNFVFPPLLNVALGGVGQFAGFTQVGSVYVKFSTGLALYQHAKDLSQDLGGYVWAPVTKPDNLQLDDFFVFASESPIAATLNGSGGRWENAVNDNALPAGVHLVMISRSTNLLVSNLGGVALDPPKTEAEWPNYNKGYYFRVGARRPKNLAQTEFLYSSGLSEQAFGRLGTVAKLNAALGTGAAEDVAASPAWKEPVATSADLPLPAKVGDTRLVLDERVIYSYVDGTWARTGLPTLQVVGELVWGVTTVATGSARGFRPTVPKGILNGVLTGWCLQCDVAGNGDTVVDIHKNGTTIFTNQANRPKLATGETKKTGATIDVTAISSEDDMTLDIDAVPGTVPTKLTVILYFRQDVKEV